MSDFLTKCIVIVFFLSVLTEFPEKAFSQANPLENIIQGDRAFNNSDYKNAIISYRKVLKTDSNNLSVMFKYAKSLHFNRNYFEASKVFKVLIFKDKELKYLEAYYFLALSEKNLSKYVQAYQHLRRLKELSQTFTLSGQILSQLDAEIESIQFAVENEKAFKRVYIQHLPSPVNSAWSDFNPVMFPTSNTLYFSRYSPVFDNDSIESIFSQAYNTEIMVAQESMKGWNQPNKITSRVNNEKYHNANICFTKNKNRVFFSRCEDEENEVVNCAIYTAEIKNGRWTSISKLGAEINVAGFSNTQPCFVENSTYKALYFVSDRSGGYGGYDIWFSIFYNDKFQSPINLGPIINTSGDEITPSFQPETEELFFSSNRHPGFGGYDIFRTKGGLSNWAEPQNLGLPINSALNDLYFNPVPYSSEAYFASNRPGSFHKTGAEYCCTDIYYVDIANDSIPPAITVVPQKQNTDSVVHKIQQLLPLSLYFHNDEPDPKTLAITTSKNFKNLLLNYSSMKDIYKKEYSSGLDSAQTIFAQKEIEDFFSDSVEGGFEKLENFAALVKKELEAGKQVKIIVRGYASPLNTKAYNLNLSKRRICSLKNFLLEYDSAVFVKYFEGKAENGARIFFYEDPLGDTKSAGIVSNNPNDLRNSVYSKAAALQRKIQIVMYSSDEYEQSSELSRAIPEMNWLDSRFVLDSLPVKVERVYKLKLKNSGNAELNLLEIIAAPYLEILPEKMNIQAGESITVSIRVKDNQLPAAEYHEKVLFLTNLPDSEQSIFIRFRIWK